MKTYWRMLACGGPGHGRLTRLGLLWIWLQILPGVPAATAGQAEHVVIMVWDGLRPDCVTPELTPTLSALAQSGVCFNRHHPVYISSTEVNGTVLITGAYPEHSGIVANREYRPGIGWSEPFATESLEAVRRADWISGGHYLAVPTLTETIQGAGFRTVVAGTKPVALLLDRAWERSSPAARQSVDLYKGRTVPATALAALVQACGGDTFPASVRHPNRKQDAWTTRALTQGLWSNEVPRLSILWLSDPDYSQHARGPGSWTARRALKSADANLATVLKTLEDKKLRGKTDILVVSDHGFSTVKSGVDIVALLKKSQFKAVKKFEDPEPGQILVAGLGGSTAFYVVNHDETVVRQLVVWLQNQDFTGVIFTRKPLAGAFTLAQARIDSINAPDVVVSMRWTGEANFSGLPGLLITDGGTRGKGAHGSLSPYDMHNSLVAAGPDFKSGWTDVLPTGNVDVAPTVLAILGIQLSHAMDGRVLTEALSTPGIPMPKTSQTTLKAVSGPWRQYLQSSTVGSTVYFDEGNGERTQP